MARRGPSFALVSLLAASVAAAPGQAPIRAAAAAERGTEMLGLASWHDAVPEEHRPSDMVPKTHR